MRRRSQGRIIRAAILGVVFGVVAYVLGFTSLGIRRLRSTPDPAADAGRTETLVRALQAREGPDVLPECRTRLVGEVRPGTRVWVVFHGLTSCPAQMRHVAEYVSHEDDVALLVRTPRHGLSDPMNLEMADMTPEEVVAFVDRAIDAAAGLGCPITTIGLSAGGLMAGWAAMHRDEVDEAVVLSPLIVPFGIPVWVARLLVRARSLLPRDLVYWWNPVKRERVNGPRYSYPRFPLSSLAAFLHLSLQMRDEEPTRRTPLGRLVLVTNAADIAVGTVEAKRWAHRALVPISREAELFEFPLADLYWHDFVDTQGLNSARIDDVYDALLDVIRPEYSNRASRP